MAPFVDDKKPKSPITPLPVTKSVHTNGASALTSTPLGSLTNLSQLLLRASTSSGRLSFYNADPAESTPSSISYADLFKDATIKARALTNLPQLTPHSVILLHFTTQQEIVEWLWASILAGYLPAISTPFVNDEAQRKKHLRHLNTLLQSPVILTSKLLLREFPPDLEELRIHDVESLVTNNPDPNQTQQHDHLQAGREKSANEQAILMLTSGSTGSAKAVPLRHGQLMKALESKSIYHGSAPGDVFLNWIGLDHVAGLAEIHLHAMSLGCDQIHVPAMGLAYDPLRFIHLLDSHKIAYTFAPNFFLTKVRDSLVSHKKSLVANLSHLKAICSGGEANVVVTCDTLAQELTRLGARGDVIRPGFGMTETCAGSIQALSCPAYDLWRGHEFASLGSCIPGLEMRVMQLGDKRQRAARGEVGELQLHGPILFDRYYNNEAATREALTSDGWFITGDLASIDEAGNLNLAGRTKDTIIVNGVKWSSTELDYAFEEEAIPGVLHSYTFVFPHRKAGSPTEDICVVYSPSYAPEEHSARFEAATAISKIVALITGQKPLHLIPLHPSLLEKTTLGKISRTKVRAALEGVKYDEIEREDKELLEQHRQSIWHMAVTPTEKVIQDVLSELVKLPKEEISANASIFEYGIDSFQLILLKNMIQKKLNTSIDIPMSVMMTDPTIAAISLSIDKILSQPPEYNPIVPLQTQGSKTPLFCIHPGSGDILVFIALAAYFPTRPVFAIRTRGYNPDERLFHSIEETAETYAHHIVQIQPEGPYAIAGYSLGSTLAFEVGKVLESQGREVRFLASIDYPPHFAHYVRDLNWIDVLVHIAFFLELVDESTMMQVTPHLHTLSREDAAAHILTIGDAERVRALALDVEKLSRISDIAENFRVHGERYEPVGSVENMDVFVADPPYYAARDRQDWRDNKLGRWADFSRTKPQFHDCPGIHARMLNREHMAEFAQIFKNAMKRRQV